MSAPDKYRIAIVGGGPAGLSAAARAAELGLPHVVLEAGPRIATTIQRCHKGKHFMDGPALLPLRSALHFGAGTREDILDAWERQLEASRANVRFEAAVARIDGEQGSFVLHLASGETIVSEFVVLAIGVQGNLRKLGIAGENLPGVQYETSDADVPVDETIVVVGAGDSGVEDALDFSGRNRVVLVNRREEFASCTQANFDRLMAAVTAGRIETRTSSWPKAIEATPDGSAPLSFSLNTPQGIERIACHRIVGRLGAEPPRNLLESFGIRFPSADSSIPELTERYECNVPGMHVIGSLAGYPLIKQAMNLGHDVVDHIAGIPVEPVDEAPLMEKLSRIPGVRSVAQGIELLKTTQPLLSSLTALQLREFMLESAIWTPAPGETIFKRNDYSNSFFSILAGGVEIEVADKDGNARLFNASRGDFFGEMGLLSGRRRSGTVRASEECVLVETPRRSMLKLLHAAPGVRRQLDQVSLKRIIRNCIDVALPESELETLVRTSRYRRYGTGEVIFSEGDKADGLYMIRSGSVTVSRRMDGRDVVLAYVPAGNYVGEMALTSDRPRSATIRAAAPTEVVVLEAEHFTAVMERNSSTRARVSSQHMDRIASDAAAVSATDSGLFSFLIDQGIGEATDVLIIDYSRCIRCDNCQTACAEVHGGYSRMKRRAGATHGDIHVPASCRHCEHPHCMKDCPPDAIHRSPNGEVFIEESCVGCGNCRANCPYGVIQLASVAPVGPRRLWQIFLGAKNGRNDPDRDAANVQRKAVKCDMCNGIIGGAACVRSCPTGAAMRASPEQYLDFLRRNH